jgi:hypothetical protein
MQSSKTYGQQDGGLLGLGIAEYFRISMCGIWVQWLCQNILKLLSLMCFWTKFLEKAFSCIWRHFAPRNILVSKNLKKGPSERQQNSFLEIGHMKGWVTSILTLLYVQYSHKNVPTLTLSPELNKGTKWKLNNKQLAINSHMGTD